MVGGSGGSQGWGRPKCGVGNILDPAAGTESGERGGGRGDLATTF